MERLREAIEHAISLELHERTCSEEALSTFIEGLYVFDEDGGLIYSKNFFENKVEPGLVSGFFSAIQSFTNNMISKEERLQEIALEERKLIFKNLADEKIVIMAITRKTMEWESKKILEKISSDINYVLKNTKVNVKMLGAFLDKYIEEVLVKRSITN
ncbi:MAG: hypothetical protein OdinLCB4_003800 [Candidatus Odinarchaeum yellowstonii]|uniref:Uncharacterized protein n=1 Tax=Odinarchaeota yellowstonii (strain LCB_4) TaxID=1841599 RepID=A0AAF0D3I5_ODILC|nr:MAG: hypothetical protein OdinLCB4_003800 [Candidatus Odinarchaeum yellowstonii]